VSFFHEDKSSGKSKGSGVDERITLGSFSVLKGYRKFSLLSSFYDLPVPFSIKTQPTSVGYGNPMMIPSPFEKCAIEGAQRLLSCHKKVSASVTLKDLNLPFKVVL